MKTHNSEKAIAFEQDAITATNTFTFRNDVEFVKVYAFVESSVRASILMNKENAIELRDFLNKFIGE